MQRDVGRIQKLTRMIHEIWCKHPQLRFHQLLWLLQSEFNQENGGVYYKEFWEKETNEKFGVVSYRKNEQVDLFYVEDEEFMKFLQKKLESYNK